MKKMLLLTAAAWLTVAQAAPIVVQPGTAAGYMYFPAQISVQSSGGGGGGGGSSGIPPCNNLSQVAALQPGQNCLTPEGGVVRFVAIHSGNKVLVTTFSDQGNFSWGGTGTDETCLTNFSSAPVGDFTSDASCLNSYGSSRPAQYACSQIGVHNPTLGNGWRLPSGGELQLLYSNRTAIGGFSASYYWSAAEHHGTYAWFLHFSAGGWPNNTSFSKNDTYGVRCVRSF